MPGKTLPHALIVQCSGCGAIWPGSQPDKIVRQIGQATRLKLDFHCSMMPTGKGISPHGLGFESGLRKMLNTPPPPSSKSAKKASKRPRRKKQSKICF
jgi:hypothetical protein